MPTYRYDEAVLNAMADNAEHPHKPLSETELFIGQVFNKRGAQTRRQRDCSEKLRSTYDRVSGAIWRIVRERPAADNESIAGSVTNASVASVRGGSMESDKNVLETALACFYVSIEGRGRGVGNRYSKEEQVETFKVLAANIFLKELEMYKKAEEIRLGAEMSSGGYVGVSGGRYPLGSGTRGGRGGQRSSRTGTPNGAPRTTASSISSSLRLVPPQVDVQEKKE